MSETTADTVCHICGVRLGDEGKSTCSAAHGDRFWVMYDAPLRAPLRIKPAFAMGDNATVARSERELVEQILRAMDASPTSEVLITPVACLSSETNKRRCLSDGGESDSDQRPPKVEDDQKNLDILKENEARFRRKMTDKYYDIEVERITQRIARSRAPREVAPPRGRANV